jgi:putative endonuclease
MANPTYTLYTGMTNNLERRLYEHRHKLTPGFTTRYNVTKLVYFEVFSRPGDAIARRKGDQGVAPVEEDRFDRGRKPRVARSRGRLVR